MTLVSRPATAEHMAAVKAALVAALPAQVSVMSWQDALQLAGNLPERYVLMQVSRRYAVPLRLEGVSTATAYRLSLRWVAKSETDAQRAADLCEAAVEYAVITVAGHTSTRVQHETTDPVRPDDGMFSGSADYTYQL